MDNNLIFDVGLHKGEDAQFYLEKGFKVVAVEANPALCEVARERLREYIDIGKLTILNVAIAENHGPISFYINESESVWGTTSSEWAKRNEALGAKSSRITVDGVNFSDIIEKYGVPYYIKIDIEGADLLCLEALKKFNSKPKFVSIESNKTSWCELVKEFRLFRSLGYSKFKVVQQLDIENQSCPIPAVEGNYVDYKFESGSSGLFGEEIPGNWTTEKKALSIYRKIFVKYWLYGDANRYNNFRKFISNIPFAWRLTKYMKRNIEAGWYDTHASL